MATGGFDAHPFDSVQFDGPLTWTLSLSDSVTVSDALAVANRVVQADSVSVSEALVAGDQVALGDSVTVSESLTAGTGLVLSLSDSGTVSDDQPLVHIEEAEPVFPDPHGWIFPVRIARRHELVLADKVRVSDEYELDFQEGIPTRQQRRELVALLA